MVHRTSFPQESPCPPEPAGAGPIDPPATASFWNLTNHGSLSTWPEDQLMAARTWEPAEAERTIRNIPFPRVDPELDPPGIKALADDLVGRLLAAGARPGDPVLVMGEFSLTTELVGRLKACGLVPLTATSTREASEAPQADGSVLLRHRFRFVRFRPY